MGATKRPNTRSQLLLSGNTTYRGPVRLPTGDGAADDSIIVNMTYVDPSPGGNVSGAMTGNRTNAGVTSCTDWAGYAAVYAEARVLGFEAHWIPKYNASGSVLAPGIGAIADSHVSTVASPASLDEVVQHTSHRMFHTSRDMKVKWRMTGTEEVTFSDTTVAPTVHGGIIWYVDGIANSVYGKWQFTYLVQFRNRK